MNPEFLRAFVAVVEEGQFRHAGDRLGISQQAVSKRIAALEDELGVALFHRLPTGAEPTADGRTFLPHARAVLTAIRHAVASVRHPARPLRVDVLDNRVASATLLRAFHEAHRELPLEIAALRGTDHAVRALLDGDIDAAFGYPRRPVRETDARLTAVPVLLEALEVVVGERHPLAEAACVTPADLVPYTCWVPGIVDGSEWGAFYAELAGAFGLTVDPTGPDFGIEALLDALAGSPALLTFVGRGTRLVGLTGRRLRRVPVVSPTPVYPWSLLWHTGNRHPGLRRLVAYVTRHAADRPADVWLPTGAPGHRPLTRAADGPGGRAGTA
ncbi:LysR family transcriptional regulator [Streptomyces uncialis]|uniref:LysR family transcriptional regulator n=1 Tax=Streptomyces uncialis TaxID=1048205 RepID=UPI0038030F3A